MKAKVITDVGLDSLAEILAAIIAGREEENTHEREDFSNPLKSLFEAAKEKAKKNNVSIETFIANDFLDVNDHTCLPCLIEKLSSMKDEDIKELGDEYLSFLYGHKRAIDTYISYHIGSFSNYIARVESLLDGRKSVNYEDMTKEELIARLKQKDKE